MEERRAEAEAEPRETSGGTTALLLGYVRARGGEDAVTATLLRAEVPYSAAELEDPARWTSYATRLALFAAATEVLGDPSAVFQVGATSLQRGVAHSFVLLMRALGTPTQVYRALPRAVPKFSAVSTIRTSDAGPQAVTVRFRMLPGHPASRLNCDYTRGLLTAVPTLFGLPPARIAHHECEAEGFAECRYELSWTRRTRLPWRRRVLARELELTALRGQLRALQSAAADLAGSADLASVLQRITDQAAAAVMAPAHLLAVHAPGGGPALVHSAGLATREAESLAAALLSGVDPGPEAVVVEIASSRRVHGVLAALYRAGGRPLEDDRLMLAAYAGHVAAALDLLVALDDARLEADRASALLNLAHELAAVGDAVSVCRVVAAELPRIVDCHDASVFLWHPEEGELRRAARSPRVDGDPGAGELSFRPQDTPELLALLADREPRLLSPATSSAGLREHLEAEGGRHVVVVPVQAAGTFLGVVIAGWLPGQTPTALVGDVVARLRGVGDQAATALDNVRLLEAVRHRASHDPLTGLPNRVLFAERLTGALDLVGTDEGLAVVFCDLDGFKAVNDTLGHSAGDQLLHEVAERLLDAIRPEDTVARLSGDEFAVLFRGVTEHSAAVALAGRLVGALRKPFQLRQGAAGCTVSAGVALHVGPGGRADELLLAADSAMYRAKRDGGDRAVLGATVPTTGPGADGRRRGDTPGDRTEPADGVGPAPGPEAPTVDERGPRPPMEAAASTSRRVEPICHE